MRGRGGEELELLEAAQRDVVEARDAASQYKAGLEHLQSLAEWECGREAKGCTQQVGGFCRRT